MILKKHHLVLAAMALCSQVWAQTPESVIKKTFNERFPSVQVDEVRPSIIKGLYEVRVNGTEILYSDPKGDYFLQGALIDSKQKTNLTQERIDKLLAIKFDTLPSKDSFTIVRGNGERKMAIFEDPNCGYCKSFERGLQKVDNVTISVYLYPILSQDSRDKSRAIWCSQNAATVWQDWMVRDKPIPAVTGACDDAALARNVEFGRAAKINGTPTLLFPDGQRLPGAVDAAKVEKVLAESNRKS